MGHAHGLYFINACIIIGLCLAHDVGEDVEAAAVGHAHVDRLHPQLHRPVDERLFPRDFTRVHTVYTVFYTFLHPQLHCPVDERLLTRGLRGVYTGFTRGLHGVYTGFTRLRTAFAQRGRASGLPGIPPLSTGSILSPSPLIVSLHPLSPLSRHPFSTLP